MTDVDRFARRQVLRAALAASAGLACGFPRPALAQTARPINIVTTSGATNFILAALMRQRGLFAEFGVEPTFTSVADGSKLMGGILTGQMDLCPLSGFGQVFPAIEKGGKVKILAGGSLLPLQCLLSAKPNIRTLKDLEGKEVDSLRKVNKAMQDSIKNIRESINGKKLDGQGYGRIPQVTPMSELGHTNISTTQPDMPLDDSELADAQDLID